MADTVSVFISHSHAQNALYEKVHAFLKNGIGRDFRDLSIDATRRVDAAWQAEAKDRISRCDVLVVIDKPSATSSDPIEWELAYARRKGKPIIAIVPQQSKHPNRSSLVAEYADDWVAWNTNALCDKVVDIWCARYKRSWFSRLVDRG